LIDANEDMQNSRIEDELIQEATELMNIFGAILQKSK